MKIKPFDATGWFPIHNAVFDVIMPTLSPSAWKVLCVAIRQTWGWSASANGQERREWDHISYSQFEAKTGLTRKTVGSALQECLDSGYLLRHQVGTWRGKPAYAYSLNREYELEVPEGGKIPAEAGATGRKFTPVTGRDFPPVTGREFTPTKQIKQTTNGGGGSPIQENIAASLLTMLGVTRGVAERLAADCDPEQIRRWVAYVQEHRGITNPAGLVVARLQSGVPAPEPRDTGQQTATCPACWRVFPVESICPDCNRCYDCCECVDENDMTLSLPNHVPESGIW